MNWISIASAILGVFATLCLYRGSQVLSVAEVFQDLTFDGVSANEKMKLKKLGRINRLGLSLLVLSFLGQIASGLGFGSFSI